MIQKNISFPKDEESSSPEKNFFKKDIFSKDVSGRSRGVKTRLPQKRTMNLALIPNDDNNLRKVLPLAVLLAAVVLLFAKFAVTDRLAALSEARERYEQSRASLAEMNQALEEYQNVREKYVRYTDNYKDDTEYTIVDKTVIIKLVNETVSGLASVDTISAVDNEVSLEVLTSDLNNVAYIKTRLDNEPLVKSVSVYTANTNLKEDETQGKLRASILITIEDPERPAPEPEADGEEGASK